MLPYIIIFFILLLTFLILNFQIVVNTAFLNQKFKITVSLLGIKLFNSDKKADKINEEIKEHKFALKDIKKLIKPIEKSLIEAKKMIKYFKRKIVCSKLEFNLEYGDDDAAQTAVTYGVIWTLTGSVYPFLESIINIKNPIINITPIFNKKCFNLKYTGIYKLKIYHIIIIAFKGIKIYTTFKNELKKAV